MGDDDPTAVGGPWQAALPISPALIPSPADAGARPINRIRVTASRASDGSALGSQDFDVSPNADEWVLDFGVTLTTQSVDVMVYVLLINVQGGAETVEFSGMAGPLTLTRGAGPLEVPDVPIVRGPLANHFTTGVAVSQAPDTLVEGSTATLRATTTTSGTTPPTVFWTVLDSAVLSVTDSTLTAVAAGIGRVVASAGAHADTASIVVRAVAPPPANVDVEILKTVDEAQPAEGATVTFTVSAVNHGPGDVTDLTVFDTIPSAPFTGPQHTTSTGTLVGDSLWTVPLLAEGATATWTTTATVATGVAGSTATNTALLRALARPDTVPANDTADVTLSFPLSAVPVVQITQPADSAVFDPGDPVTFTATATDDLDGDLSQAIVWTSSRDGDLGTGSSVSASSLSTGVHTVTATATDSHNGVGTDSVTVTISLYTVPATLNVPFGGTASLPITLSEPAPAGGVTLSVTSDDATVTSPTASTVFIAQGAQSENATLSGIRPGTANVTVGNPQYGAAVSSVSVTAELDILGGNVSISQSFGQTITIQLESTGTPIDAPEGGLQVTLTSDDPGCVAPSSPVTIPSGLVSTTATVAYGGSAALSCQAYVRASAPDVVSDSVSVTVSPTPGITVYTSTVASGLQTSASGQLGASNHGGVTVRVTSSDPRTLLVSPNATTPGTEFIDVVVANGSTSVPYYIQGFEGATGTPTVTMSAPGFIDGSNTFNVVAPGITLSGLSTSLTTLSPNDAFWATIGYPYGTYVIGQNIRAGGSAVTVTFTSTAPSVATLVTNAQTAGTVTATIGVGQSNTPTSLANQGVEIDPLTAGQTTVSASATGFITQPDGDQTVTVSP
ncbi:MAG TPA: Ig-like domain-containing protein [Longimicrobiales bacterium]|nr:Ig-like domain-containing protein [Longimicrobiales bacterium]